MSQFALSTGNLLYIWDYYGGDFPSYVWYIPENSDFHRKIEEEGTWTFFIM